MRLVTFSDLDREVPAGTRRLSPDERQAVMAARRLAVSKRFCR
jgi:hypothetical protein